MSGIVSVRTDEAVQPHGHYSQGIKAGPFLFVSGILGNNEHYPEAGRPDVEIQARRCLEQIEAIVAAAGGDRSHIVKVSVFVTDLSLWPRVNAVYGSFFDEVRPARIVVPSGELRFDSSVEMDAIAYFGE